jgi:hypothetical protein
MATLESFQDLKDACDDLTEISKSVKNHNALFMKGSNFFQKLVVTHEPNYRKIEQDAVESMIKTVNDLITCCEEAIKLEKQ